MAPPQQSKPKAKPAVTFPKRPGREEMKVSVLNICGPFPAGILRTANVQSNMATKRILVHRPQPPVSEAADKPDRSSTLSEEPQTTNQTVTMRSCLHKDSIPRRTGSSTQRLTGHSPGLRPKCLTGVKGPLSALKECLVITSLRHQTYKKTDKKRP